MNLHHQKHGAVDLIRLPERLVMANADDARESLRARIDDGCLNLVLDLQPVEFVDSSGLSVLVFAFKELTARNGHVVLLGPSDEVLSLIELTRLHEVFEIYADREAAIAELQ